MSSSDLPISRVNRILRPLRNKCALLASTTSSSSRRSRAANPITYSSNSPSSQWQADDHPPLAILQTPQHLVSRVHLDRHSLGNLDLSRKIYAVVDAFKNVLQASFGAERDEGEKKAFLSLTDICAAVVGENVQAEIEWTADEEDDEEDIEEDAEKAIVDDIYEAVPSRFRRWTLVAHALSIVMDQCPHHITLMTCILDMTIAHRLPHESRLLLHSLLAVALSPTRGMPAPPICHPAHTSYLKQLCAKWTSNSTEGDVGLSIFFSERTFARILADVMADVAIAEVWTCKAVSRFARQVQASDFIAFLPLMDSLVQVVARKAHILNTRRKYSKKSAEISPHDDDDAVQLCDRLTRWLQVSACRPVLSLEDAAPTNDADSSEEVWYIINILSHVQPITLYHLPRDSKVDDPYREVQDALVNLTTRIVSSPLFPSCSPKQSVYLIDILQSIKPLTSTYDGLVKQTFPGPSADSASPPPTTRPPLQDSLRVLHTYATSLRNNSLRALEASLWTCALRYFEREVTLSSPADARGTGRIRNQLMDAVSEAEQRLCGATPSTQVSQSTVSGDELEAESAPAGEWEWEEMIGSFVRKSPLLVKTARPCVSALNRRMRTRSSGPTQEPLSAPVFRTQTAVASTSRSSSTMAARAAPVPINHETGKRTRSTPSLSTSAPVRQTSKVRPPRSVRSATPGPSRPSTSQVSSIPASPGRRPVKKQKREHATTHTTPTKAVTKLSKTSAHQYASAPVLRRTPSSHSAFSSASSSTKTLASTTTTHSSASSSSISQGSRSITPPTDIEDKAKDKDEDDEDDFDNLLTPTKKLKARKLTNFRSMLADSHMNAICLHPERALARKQALKQTSASAPPIITRRTKRLPALKSFSPSPSPSPERRPSPAPRPARAMKGAPRYAYEYGHSESSESDYVRGDGDGDGSDVLDEYEDEEHEELDRIRGRVSIGQESMSSDDVLDLFAYDDSV